MKTYDTLPDWLSTTNTGWVILVCKLGDYGVLMSQS